jgi:hypothetical protein
MRNLSRSPLLPLPLRLSQPLMLLMPLLPLLLLLLPLPKPQNSHWCLRSLRGTLLPLPTPLPYLRRLQPRWAKRLRCHHRSNAPLIHRLAAPSSAESQSASCPSQR